MAAGFCEFPSLTPAGQRIERGAAVQCWEGESQRGRGEGETETPPWLSPTVQICPHCKVLSGLTHHEGFRMESKNPEGDSHAAWVRLAINLFPYAHSFSEGHVCSPVPLGTVTTE